jgi:signal transduction histidine kinase
MQNLTCAQKNWCNTIVSILFLVGLYLTSFYSYLLFHSLAELFSVVIACAIFMFAWNTRHYVEGSYFTFIGIAYLFIGAIDTLHTLAYPGMPIFTDYDYYANQLWIIARFMEATSLLAAFYFLPKGRRLNIPLALIGYGVITGLLILSVFYWKSFPECFVAGQGQTPFKIISEYLISTILAVTILLLYRNRNSFSTRIFHLILYSLIATIVAELAFTFYISNYGISNLVGHLFKILSFKLIYEAIIATGLQTPHELLYLQLKQREQELNQSNQTKDRLLKIIAHDLRNPFVALVNLTDLLLVDFDHLDSQKKKDYIHHIHGAAKNTHDLLENLLNWSTLQSNGLQPHPMEIDLRPLVDKNLALHGEAARYKGITLQSDIGPGTQVYADANMLNTIIRNLISNAIKFTASGGQVAITSKTLASLEEITVSDTGTGIDKGDMEKLFHDSFGMTRPGTAQELGTGLGLTLCRELVQELGGTIRAESTPGKGSRFIFTLPKSG